MPPRPRQSLAAINRPKPRECLLQEDALVSAALAAAG